MKSLQQTLEITLLEVQQISIHNSPYYQVTYQTEADNTLQQMRINPEAFYANPKAGDKVSVNLLMGNVMGAKRLG